MDEVKNSTSASSKSNVHKNSNAEPSTNNTMASKAISPPRLFAECALVEIIHLHDCLRGALYQIQKDVNSLVMTASVIKDESQSQDEPDLDSSMDDKENRDSRKSDGNSETFNIEEASELSTFVSSRFHLVWSVFQAHSGAEDEFIWPALKMKIESKKRSSNTGKACDDHSSSSSSSVTEASSTSDGTSSSKKCGCESFLEQESYEEDHATEETMFKQINKTLRRLNGSFRFYNSNPQLQSLIIIKKVIEVLKEQTDNLTDHLVEHLQKEETQCLPMVKKHLNNDEISTLVGQIMGKRSAEMMGKILNLAVCSLPGEEREDMVKCLKKAMGGTFFEKWLKMVGWDSNSIVRENNSDGSEKKPRALSDVGLDGSAIGKRKHSTSEESSSRPAKKMSRYNGHITDSRLRYPSRYYEKEGNEIVLKWNSAEARASNIKPSEDVPQFAQTELTPTYRFNESCGTMVLGCEHYDRSCKLRHPETGQLFTCRLCCEDARQSNKYTYDALPVLDRNAVTEVMCMKCGAVQPAGPKCVNDACDSKGAPFARYFCSICNLYDDAENKDIYHCPYCNVCRKGKGLGIDFRHCMRCNACIDISEYDTHVCISQRLQGTCPICKESMFESTEPLRGMKCGHVMHLSCFNQYASRCSFGTITCPLCKQVFENLRG